MTQCWFWTGYLVGALSLLVVQEFDADGRPGFGHVLILGIAALNVLGGAIVARTERRLRQSRP